MSEIIWTFIGFFPYFFKCFIFFCFCKPYPNLNPNANTSFGNSTWLKLKKLSKLSLRSKLMTYVKLAVKSIVDNFINFDNFEQSDNFRKLSNPNPNVNGNHKADK